MDLDATIRGQNLTETQIIELFRNILSVSIDDDGTFTFKKIEEIREEAEYPSYRVSFEARLDTIPAKQPNVESGYYYRGFDYCNKVFARKGWRSSTGVDRKVWQCSERYKVKGIMRCSNHHVEEKTLEKAYMIAWNALAANRECFLERWQLQRQSENLLASYRAEKFIEYTDREEQLTEMDTDFMLKTLIHIEVFEDGFLKVVFMDGTEIECKNEEE